MRSRRAGTEKVLRFWLIHQGLVSRIADSLRCDSFRSVSIREAVNRRQLVYCFLFSLSSFAFSVQKAEAQSFQRVVTPVLTKAGCNQGSCHGAAAGRGGFRLSLYGSDPEADYREIVFQLGGRRLHRLDPERSLLLLKATETVEHGGGQRLIAGGEGAERIADWVQRGAYWHQSSEGSSATNVSETASGGQAEEHAVGVAKLLEVKVIPSSVVLPSAGSSFRLNAQATFDDGTQENVTNWTVFDPDDESAVKVDPESCEVTVLRTGRHLLIARYLNRVTPVEILVPFSSGESTTPLADVSSSKLADDSDRGSSGNLPSDQIIDSWVDQRIQVLGLQKSPPCDDATFLRRCSLDLVGRLPTEVESQDYFKQPFSERRGWLIDSLLGSESFNRYWTLQLAKLFRLRSLPNSDAAVAKYHAWIGDQLESDLGYDQIVKALLTARGDVSEIGAANFLRTANGPRERAELVSEVMMGSRLRCANCHDHPLDQWTQDDYHGLAAILATISVGQQVQNQPDGRVTHPKTGQDALPKLPAGGYLAQKSSGSTDAPDSITEPTLSDAFTQWLLDDKNPYFAKTMVNRLWKSMMGRGLVDPVDDFRQTNPPTHPELLDQLTQDFIRSGYDLRATLRLIASSHAYQRSSATTPSNEADRFFYSHFYDQPLEPEVLSDAISDVLQVSIAYGQQPLGTRAVDLVHPQIESRALDVLGRCSRESSCESSGESSNSGLSEKLFLLNGEFINGRLKSEEGRLARLLSQGSSPLEIIQNFYRAALQRSPDPRELAYWEGQLNDCPVDEYQEFLGDFVWSLIASREFTHKD